LNKEADRTIFAITPQTKKYYVCVLVKGNVSCTVFLTHLCNSQSYALILYPNNSQTIDHVKFCVNALVKRYPTLKACSCGLALVFLP